MKTSRLVWMTLALPWLLSACDLPADDLNAWMNEQRNQTLPPVQIVEAPRPFIPLSYGGGAEEDPFVSRRLTQLLRSQSASSGSSAHLIAGELNRRKEPLESFPLDDMSMVGSLEQNDERVALLKVGSLLYQVHEGNYLGQNFGRVVRISENEVVLREIVQDGVDEWIERPASLQLQEKHQ